MDQVVLAVNGGLMRGMPSNQIMLDAGAVYIRDAETAPEYRLWSIDDRHPAMMRVTEHGAGIALELWNVSAAGFVHILRSEPVGLSVAKVVLDTGESVLGVVGEPFLCEGRLEITAHGGWREYLASKDSTR